MLILSVLTISLFSQDKKISGVINVYRQVVAIGPGTDNITLNRIDSISAGDTVLLIQMKGLIINGLEGGSYGSYKDFTGAPGLYEFLIVESVNSGTKEVIFTNSILHNFDISGEVQLVKVPFYNSATVKNTLTCQPWDSIKKTGGVLAMIVGRTLSLEADIDVTGKGFGGGTPYLGQGICIETNSVLYDKFSYPESYLNSGYKGESPVIKVFLALGNVPSYFPDYAKGKGANLTGGGGGNGRYSGGGGGSNYGAGGKGGRENSSCLPTYTPQDGGVLGKDFKSNSDLYGGIFMGGGGGSSTKGDAASSSSSGGKGGGIIFIICDTLKGKGKVIKAEGATPGITASGNAGAGGGGGGGSIAIYLQSFSTILASSSLTISANGGRGGNNAGSFGEGGGGGGGFIQTNNITNPGNVSESVTGGLVGTRSGSTTGGAGSDGENLTTFSPILNGFLFNSIRSAITLDQVDSICSNVPFGVISGTKPVGGVEGSGYHFLWEKSTVSDVAGFAAAPGINNLQNYSPGLLTETSWFRRIVTDNGVPVLTDISKTVKIIVQQAITGNLIGKDTTICFNQNPLPLLPLNAGPSNGSSNNYYLYKWIQNNSNTNWNTSPVASGTYTNTAYDPPALTGTTYFQRVVTSGRCVDYSSSVTITVLPLITGNITSRPDSVICEGSLFNNLGASAPGGGDLVTYKYQWQDSITSSVWKPAVGTNTGVSYIPDTATFSVLEERYMRRVVFSGPDSVCKNRSVPILLTRYHKLKNNTIQADQTICSGSSPSALTGSTPLQGKSGEYFYTWQDSTKSHAWTNISGAVNLTTTGYQPVALTDTSWYRRIVNSSKCTSSSLSVRINVHKPIANFSVSLIGGGLTDTTICNGQTPHMLKGTISTGGNGSFAYQWKYSADNSSYLSVPSGGTSVSYQPSALTNTTYYKREVISGACTVLSNPITLTVLPLIGNNTVSANQTVCYNTNPSAVTGSVPSGGNGSYTYYWEQSTDNGTTWAGAAGTNNSGSYSPPSLTIKTQYRRTVRSGLSDCCSSVSNAISIDLYSLPTGAITNISDTTICGGLQVQLKVNLTGAAPWNITFSENGIDGATSLSSGNSKTLTANPSSPSAINVFTYQLSKIKDNNGCFATSLLGIKKANVYQVPKANAGPDQIVCGSKAILSAIPSVGTGIWISPSAVIASTVNSPKVTVTVDSSYAGGNIIHQFYWEETNWQCKSKDSVIVTFDKQISSINAGPDASLYTFDNIFNMAADPVIATDGQKGEWTVVAGSGDFDNNTDPKTKVTNVSIGNNTYLWTIINGKCKLEDQVNVDVYEIFIPEGFSPNNDPEGYNNTFVIKGLENPNQTAELKVLNGAGTEVFSTSNRGGQIWIDWNGRNSKGVDLPEGTYYYLLKIISEPDKGGNGQVFKKSGFVILKRY